MLQAWEAMLFGSAAECDLASAPYSSSQGAGGPFGGSGPRMPAALLQPTATLSLNPQNPWGLASDWRGRGQPPGLQPPPKADCAMET